MTYEIIRFVKQVEIVSEVAAPAADNVELREDGSYELREDGTLELRE